MVDERGLIKSEAAPKSEDEGESKKEQLQHEMEEARESISQTVGEIGDVVSSQAKAIRETISKKLDWREHVRKHPGAVGIGALTLGFIVGYGIIGAINKRSNGAAYRHDEYEIEEDRAYSKHMLQPERTRSHGPSWFDKLKSTRAFNRLRDETNNLVNQFINEAVNIGRTVLIPAAVNKISKTINSSLDSPENQTYTTSQRGETRQQGVVNEKRVH